MPEKQKFYLELNHTECFLLCSMLEMQLKGLSMEVVVTIASAIHGAMGEMGDEGMSDLFNKLVRVHHEMHVQDPDLEELSA